MPKHVEQGATAGGDLAGSTYPNPVVASLQGVVISGTPSSAQVLTATSPTAAHWAAPTGGGAVTSLTTTGSGAATLSSGVLNVPTPPTATFNSLTTTGTSGAATLASGVLNIPQYAGATYSAGTGLALASGVFSVNASQAITTLTVLTTAGSVMTTSAGVLSSVANTGSGSNVLATSPTLVTPILGTPTSVTLTNATGLPIAGLTGLGTGVATLLAAVSTGTGGLVGSTSPTLVTPTLGTAAATSVTVTGGGVTLAAGTTTIAPLKFVSGASLTAAVSGVVDYDGTTLWLTDSGPTRRKLMTDSGTYTLQNKTFDTAGNGNSFKINGVAVTAVTGTGSAVLATSPTLVTPALGTPTAIVLTNATGLVASTGTTATGTPSATTYLRGDNTWATPASGFITSLTTTGTSGAATVSSGVLNIPNYASGGGSGTVTSASVVSANGFTGTVATATTTPAITLTTSITGVLKGNGTAILAATAGTDYQVPISLTTTGSGAATFASGVLNIPTTATTAITATSAYSPIGTTEDTQGYTYPTFRQNLRGTISPTSGTLSLYGFTAGVSRTISKLSFSVGSTAAAGVTYCALGLYTYNTATGALTLVASTPNTTTAGGSAYNFYQIGLSASYALVAGTRYMVGFLMLATTMPVMNAAAGSDDYGNNNFVSGVQNRLVGQITGETTLPATIADSAIGANGNAVHVLMIM